MTKLPVSIPENAQGRIITSVGVLYTVETSSGICTCKARGIFRKRGITPYVGDYVMLSEDGVISEILPRKNSILRPPVSNLDQIFFVTSTCHPTPNLLLLDSFLTVAIYQDIQPAVILTKVDLDRGEKLESLYADAGIPVYLVDYDKPETIDNVAKLLDGKISMMTGNSGVGKSTLLNAIAPELQLATGEISEKLGRGKHTTRQVQLYPARRLSGRHAGLFYL
ncbi:MAG: ribosome small subunit-dependent GTPase A [Ruminococcus sp.]